VTGTILPNSGHLNIKILGDSAQVDYIGAYHVENAKADMVNGKIRRTYYVKANSISTGIEHPLANTSKIEAYQSDNRLYVKSISNVLGQISIYSISGQYVGKIHQGIISSGTSEYQLPYNIKSGLYIINIETEKAKLSLKILKQ
jgi:hypothetical protein